VSLKSLTYRWLVGSWFGVLLNSRLVTIIATAVFGGTMLYLDIFGSRDSFVEKNFETFRRLFFFFIIGALFVQIFRWVADWSKGINSEAGSTMVGLVISVGRIVEQKALRFRMVAQSYKGTKAFEQLTQPEVQIELILKEINDYLADQHKVQEQQPDATVLYLSDSPRGWQYIFRSNPNRTRTPPDVLMSRSSAAKYAFEKGQPCFFPSKHEANGLGRYLPGPDESNNGSIYCYPVKILTPSGDKHFVITFATYGECLCDAANASSSKAFSLIFREFSRRIELELILWTIKGFKKQSVPRKVNRMRPRKS
jgi:hypothetical protein